MIAETLVTPTRFVWPEPTGLEAADPSSRPTSITLGSPAGPDPGPDSLGGSVVLDFGVEVFGGIRCRVLAVEGDFTCQLRVRLGESVSEALAGAYVDRQERVRPGTTLDVGVTGFRFARIDLIEPSVRVTITLPSAYNQMEDRPEVGSFRSSDPRLDTIWAVGARTVRLCMRGPIWDGIKRGRTVWAGDLYPAAAAVLAVFGADPSVPASLDHLRDRTDRPYGPDWMNGIPGYSLWWVICHEVWFRHTGDRDYLGAQRDYLSRLLAVIAEDLAPVGREQFLGWRYLDWATTRDPAAIHEGYHALAAWALRAAATIGESLGDDELRDRAQELLARVESYRPPPTSSKAARALLVLAGLADAAEINRVSLAPDPAAGLTPFLGYPVLEARAHAGDHAGALELIRTYWGAMIHLGATTFWEDFDLDWVANSAPIDALVAEGRRDVHAGLGRNTERGMGLSLCHAWSSGPTAWLTRHVLGVRPREVGFRSVRIDPHLGDLDHASGTVPTPLGPIQVRHTRRADGSIATEYEAPVAIEVVGPTGHAGRSSPDA